MQLRWWLALASTFVATVALADGDAPRLDGLTMGNDGSSKGPRFAWTGSKVFTAAKTSGDADEDMTELVVWRGVDGMSADKQTVWLSGDLAQLQIGCGMAPCPPPPPPPAAEHHATVLYEKVGKDWQLVAWHIAPVVSAKAQAAAVKAGLTPPVLTRQVDGVDDVATVFAASIKDPKALAKTVSDRKDVVLYGSEAAERYVGGAKVKTQLAAWNLSFSIRDGVRGGLTAGKTVAWIAANVDAASLKRPKDKPVAYRALFIYEKKGADWKLVNAHFSIVAEP